MTQGVHQLVRHHRFFFNYTLKFLHLFMEYMRMSTHMCACLYMYVCTFMPQCVYAFICAHMLLPWCVCVYAHTHMHAHA